MVSRGGVVSVLGPRVGRAPADDHASDVDRDRLAACDHHREPNVPVTIRWMSRRAMKAAKPSNAANPHRWPLSSIARSNGPRRRASTSTTTLLPASTAGGGTKFVKPTATNRSATRNGYVAQ